jgi:hypothetical protein
MKRHVDLLGLLYIVGGALSLVAAASLFVLSIGAFSLVVADGDEQAALAARLTGLALAVVALTLGAWGGANAWVGRALRRGAAWARLACFGLAVFNLFLLPFGTALSVYTLWVLLHQETRRLLSSPP